jgi:hypothetical protein
VSESVRTKPTNQLQLRRKIARLKALQEQRIELAQEVHRLTDLLIAKKQQEIVNLEAQQLMRVVS